MCDLLHPIRLEELARNWILEDTSSFDFAGAVVEDHESEFEILMKTPGVLAGTPFADAIFSQLNITALWFKSDGDRINSVTKIASLFGTANKLLLAESLVLSVLSRASGVATIASKMKDVLKNAGWNGILAGSPATPGFRSVEKYALLIGGADVRQYDLSNIVMLKDTHITVAGSIQKAVENVRRAIGFSLKVEVECRSIQEAIEAGKTSCDIIMLDNFGPQELAQHALNLKYTYKLQNSGILIGASGVITEQNIQEYVCPWLNIISSSNLVQGCPTINFCMRVKTQTITLDD